MDRVFKDQAKMRWVGRASTSEMNDVYSLKLYWKKWMAHIWLAIRMSEDLIAMMKEET